MEEEAQHESIFNSDIEEDKDADDYIKIRSFQDDQSVQDGKKSGSCDSNVRMKKKKKTSANDFIKLQNGIIDLESIPKRRRTKEQLNKLNALKKSWIWKNREKFPHLLLLLKDQRKATQDKCLIKGKPGLGEKAAMFGEGTIGSPQVKFYFTSPCPQLGK